MIVITHTHEGGTLVEGSRKGDGVLEILRGLRDNWRYFPSLRQIGLGQSRDKAARTWVIERAAEALRKAGHEVEVSIDNEARRTFAEAEAERCERAEDRADRYEGYADNAAGRSEAAFTRAHSLGRRFEGGQPILIGHHSERSARNAQRKMWAADRRGIGEMEKAQHWAERAGAAERYRERRESVPTTLRRIEKLEAEARQIQRRLDGTDRFMSYGKPAEGEWREQLEVRARDIAEEITYWRQHVAEHEAAGIKVWSKADFAKGDFAQFGRKWFEVLRVNAKSLTIPAMINDGLVVTKANGRLDWTDTIPYHEVTGRKTRGEIEAGLRGEGPLSA